MQQVQVTNDISVGTRWKCNDPSWDLDGPTNYRLKDGDQVQLVSEAVGDCSAGFAKLPAGTVGTIAVARTPKVRQRVGSSLYFANVDCLIDGLGKVRVRVPHGAIQKVPYKSKAAAVLNR